MNAVAAEEHSAEVAVLPVQHQPAAVVHTRRFSPVSLPDRLKYANELAMAGLLPKDYRRQPANVLLAMEYADSLGIPLVQALSTIAVIDGKPSAQASLIAALVRRAGHRLRVECHDLVATATIVRCDDPTYTFKAVWDIPRAVRAKLCTADPQGNPRAVSSTGKVLPWQAYPEAMLKARATTEVARDACQEALLGIMYTPEELGAIVNEDGSVVDDASSAGAQRVEPVEVTTAPPVPLPEDFEATVTEAEEKRDLQTLRELYDHAVRAQDVRAKAFAMSAGQRVKKYLAEHPEDVPLPDVVDADVVETEQADSPSSEELDGVSSA